MALKALTRSINELRKELGVEHLPDGRIVLPSDFCFAALANFMQFTSEESANAAIDVLEDVEEILGVCVKQRGDTDGV